MLITLSACGGSGSGGGVTEVDIPTTSDFRATDAEGYIILDAPTGENFSQRSIWQNFGYGASYGVTSEVEGVSAYAELGAPTKNTILPDPAPAIGTGIYSGSFGLLGVSDVNSSLEIVDVTGDIDLNVDFVGRTITGETADIAFDMRIENTQDLTGTVAWEGIDGEVTGRVGEFSLLGAFHGSNENGVFAGAVSGSR